jgi:hypothetical protein
MQLKPLLHETPNGKPMSGKALALRVKKTSPAQRAALAAWIARGEVSIAPPTTAQTALLTHLSPASVSLVKGATDEDLAALRRGGLSLRQLRAKTHKKPIVAKSVGEIEAFVGEVGLGAVKEVFDHLFTQSHRVEIEIENFLCRCKPADVASVLDGLTAPAISAAAE